MSNQPWGLQEPSGESCVAADSALQWRWNSMRCVISAHVVCEAMIARCPSPEVKAGAYIALGAASEGHHYNVGQVIEYACQEGYAPTLAKPESRCLKNGTWSGGGTPDCTFHDCKDDIFLGMFFFISHGTNAHWYHECRNRLSGKTPTRWILGNKYWKSNLLVVPMQLFRLQAREKNCTSWTIGLRSEPRLKLSVRTDTFPSRMKYSLSRTKTSNVAGMDGAILKTLELQLQAFVACIEKVARY